MEQLKEAQAASANVAVEAKPATPTIDEIVEAYLDGEEQAQRTRVNVFAECLKNGEVVISTEDQASEIARMMNRADDDLENAKAIAKAMIAKAEARVSALSFLFHAQLAIWTALKLVGKKGRSILLEGGKLALRKVNKSTKYVDDAVTLEWAQKNLPAAVEMVPKLKLDVVLEWEEANDQAAPGRELTPEHDAFKVSVPK